MKYPEVTIASLEHPEKGSYKIGPFGSSLKKDELVEEGIPVVGIENILPNEFVSTYRKFITGEKYNQLSRYAVQPGDVLVTTMGTIGRAAVAPNGVGTMIYDSHLFRMRVNQNKILPKYLTYALNNYEGLKRQINQRARGAIMAGLNTTILKECTIPLPPLAEQQRIAAILDKADALRAKRRAALAKLDTLLQSTFLHMFGDPVTNPMGWKIRKLGGFLTFITSGSRGWAKYYSENGTRFIRSLDVRMNRISDEDIVYVRAPDTAETNRTQVKPNDVLLTITGSRIGRVATVPSDFGKASISQHVAILRLDESKIRPRFIAMFLSLDTGGQRQISNSAYGQTKPGLNFRQIRSFEIPCPPIKLQDKFLSYWDKLDQQVQKYDQGTKQLDNLFHSLQQRAFKGEI